jgi:cbb3-type cytochrome oxidase subunit 1
MKTSANPASIKLPLMFIVTGVLSLFAGVGVLVASPSILATYHYNQQVIAVTHLFVLGWICTVVMGAMYQLVPVALETKLHSERLAWCQFGLHVIGFVGMVWMFQVWNMKQVGHFGCVLALGGGFFVYNITRTLWRVPKWNVTATAVTAALVWISVAMIAGLCIAAGKCVYSSDLEGGTSQAGMVPGLVHALRGLALFMSRFNAISAMHAHAHLGAVGFFTMLIVGVSYKLIPMFTLSEIQSRWRAGLSVALLNISLVGTFITILAQHPLRLVFAISGAAALGIYVWELRAILAARKRRMLDWGVRYFLTAVAILLSASLLGLALSWPRLPLNVFTGQLENVYGFLGLIGAISFAIIGMLYKIVPFLVWFGRYSPEVGRQKVPSLSEMYSPGWQAAGYWTFLAGLSVTCAAILCSSEAFARLGCVALGASMLCLAVNLSFILSHFAKPRLQPLTHSPAEVLEPA